MAESSRDKAEKELREAKAMKNNVNLKIVETVNKEKKKIVEETERTIRRNKLENLGTVGSLTVGVMIYCVIITFLWLVDHSEPLKTIPKWFISRGENIKAIWNGINNIYLGVYNLIQPHINDLLAKGISFIIALAVVCVVGYFLIKILYSICSDISSIYNDYDKHSKLLKYSGTVSIMTVSIPLAMMLVELFPNSINIVSWWIVTSFILTIAYFKITFKD